MKVGKDFRPEYSPLPDDAQAVPGFNEPKIVKGISVRDQKKRCFLSSDGSSLASYDTNDVRMKYGSSTVRITKTSVYLVNWCIDLAPNGLSNLLVNGTTVSTAGVVTGWSTRMLVPWTRAFKLKTWDLVSLSYSWTPAFTNSTYLQVLEL